MAKQASVEYGVLQAAIEFFNRHVFFARPQSDVSLIVAADSGAVRKSVFRAEHA